MRWTSTYEWTWVGASFCPHRSLASGKAFCFCDTLLFLLETKTTCASEQAVSGPFHVAVLRGSRTQFLIALCKYEDISRGPRPGYVNLSAGDDALSYLMPETQRTCLRWQGREVAGDAATSAYSRSPAGSGQISRSTGATGALHVSRDERAHRGPCNFPSLNHPPSRLHLPTDTPVPPRLWRL
ncbi:uncharacterized protein CLUP02_08467 [Colletotrichum lupini]|uniref:Uncharacterized protein n=1 Tax=Colletotrichum lupini TaxID=145971 RepID=A0A9Q8SSW9_9PEZI|nr:uncharacterized protein CLUP02_08467 [Colletotrichum lupini]UQC82977.1 hypothetical protein CLUP02_08467 [Colletotrichum lupini]